MNQLEDAIEHLREQMVTLALRVGLDHPEVYRLSRQIDQLHTEWCHLKRGEARADVRADAGNTYSINRFTSKLREERAALAFA
ncbi:aspartyl-phosphate phosphatase Spo0E family protein [Numidum massiliense]|uniref:aspartyl-phosphate phosphatase Spo0E family protein n=1 Tax=Numidum massiliense TaxID=1522315 RepID=UPI0006D56044|nr:aspartyl-phosphate phosphatase Spo0E family protein [Numidum massiliense]